MLVAGARLRTNAVRPNTMPPKQRLGKLIQDFVARHTGRIGPTMFDIKHN